MDETRLLPVQGSPSPAPASASDPRLRGLRPEIQALRAVAVASVMLFHLWPNRLRGGYVGVDVFFVVSGYLMTSHLLREAVDKGRVGVARFWARRATRLLPASLLVLGTTAAVVLLLVPSSLWRQFLHEVLAATFYVENWQLASDSVNYLAAENTTSPVQHYWTLSAEEQFYVALPLLIAGALFVARVVRLPERRVIAGTLATIVMGSLAYSMWLTAHSPSVAYFSTGTRAWEFGLGGLLAFVAYSGTSRLRSVVSWAGVLAVAAACIGFTSNTAFPGYSAALPVLGAAAVIWAGNVTGPGGMGTLGRMAPVALLGRVSYGVYLWHWPLIVLLPYATGTALRTGDKLAIVVGSVLLAWLSTRFVEDPVRYSPRLLGGRPRPRAVALWSVAAMGAVSAIAVLGLTAYSHAEQTSDNQVRDLLASQPDCLGAAARGPGHTPCVNPDLKGILVPSPAQAANDDPNNPDCWARDDDAAFRWCTLGPKTGYGKRLFAIGDSHSNVFLAAYEEVARTKNWRIDVAGHSSCYWTDAVQEKPVAAHVRACETWKEAFRRHLAGTDPYDGIVVTYSRFNSPVVVPAGMPREEATVAGLRSAWRTQTARGTKIFAIADVPRMGEDVVACVEKYDARANRHCSEPRARALALFDGMPDATARTKGTEMIDLTDVLCTAHKCLPVIGNVVVYRDPGHLTGTFANTLVPLLARRLEAGLQ